MGYIEEIDDRQVVPRRPMKSSWVDSAGKLGRYLGYSKNPYLAVGKHIYDNWDTYKYYGGKAYNYLTKPSAKSASASRASASAKGGYPTVYSHSRSIVKNRSKKYKNMVKKLKRSGKTKKVMVVTSKRKNVFRKTNSSAMARKVLRSLQAPQRYYENYALSASVGPAHQGVIGIEAFDQQDVIDVFASAGLSPQTNQKLFVERSDIKVSITNQSNFPANLTFYLYKCRRGANSTGRTAWLDGIATVAGTPPTIGQIGATPYMSPKFTTNYKIISVWGKNMNAGESKDYTLKGPKGVLQQSLLDNGNVNYRKWTLGLMIVFKGATVHDAEPESLSAPTTAFARLDVAVNEDYIFRSLPVSAPRITYANTMPVPIEVEGYLNTGIKANSSA